MHGNRFDRCTEAAADEIDVLGAATQVLLRPSAADSTMALMRQRIPPGYAAPRHRHDDEDEALYVVEGEITVTDDSGARVLVAGDVALARRGDFHAFVNHGSTAATLLVVCTPGRKLDACFRAFDLAGRRNELTPDRIGAIAARHGIEIAPLS